LWGTKLTGKVFLDLVDGTDVLQFDRVRCYGISKDELTQLHNLQTLSIVGKVVGQYEMRDCRIYGKQP
jgi:hypothetical protein